MLSLSDGRKLYSSPGDDTQTEFLNIISACQKNLLICDYSFNLPQLATILPTLQSKGVAINLILDRSQSKGKNEAKLLSELSSAGIDMVIGTSSKHQIMHDKLAVVDNLTIYGSWNFTANASAEDNFFVLDPNPDINQWFTGIINNIRNWIMANEPQSKGTK
jgi:phosphatidylserine/phosphatidylglycerophosphate/cardiolipin synthase-like enzyme